MNLTIGEDEAIILYELLAESDGGDTLDLREPSRRLAMTRLFAAFEYSMVEPFQPDYQALLDAARIRLNQQAGHKH